MIRSRSLSRSRAFTLLEMLIALAIVSLFVTVAVPVIGAKVLQEKVAHTRTELDTLAAAITDFFEDTATLPSTIDQLEINSPTIPGWQGPYLSKGSNAGSEASNDYRFDSWHSRYAALANGPSTFRIRSAGPDRTQDTSDDILKIVDVSGIRRQWTRDELDVINAAIDEWNAKNTTPLPLDVEASIETLVGQGYLPGPESQFLRDGWNTMYQTAAGGLNQLVAFDSTWGVGAGNGFTTICHCPPGNPENCSTLVLPNNAVPGHLAHGDTIGACDDEGEGEEEEDEDHDRGHHGDDDDHGHGDDDGHDRGHGDDDGHDGHHHGDDDD